jgi:hypothetical protein
VLNHDYCYDYVKQSEEYCKLIPQKIRGKFDARKLFNTKYDVENQNNLLDALENSIKLIEDLEKNSDNKVKLFNTSIAEVTDNKVIDDIKALYNKTHNSMHACRDLKVKRVFEIKIDKMDNEYTVQIERSRKRLAKALNLIEALTEDLEFVFEQRTDWNDSITWQIQEAATKLGFALATLINWYDDVEE